MPGISKIPENINKYALEWARKICKEPVENGIGFDFIGGNTFFDRVLQESPVYKGTEHHLVNFDFRGEPHDIFVHNHPLGSPLSMEDVFIAVNKKVKKIFASTQCGFTSLDFTPITESAEMSRNTMEIWADQAVRDSHKYKEELDNVTSIEKNPKEKIWVSIENNIKLQEYLNEKLKEFAKFSGAIFENLWWSELK